MCGGFFCLKMISKAARQMIMQNGIKYRIFNIEF